MKCGKNLHKEIEANQKKMIDEVVMKNESLLLSKKTLACNSFLRMNENYMYIFDNKKLMDEREIKDSNEVERDVARRKSEMWKSITPCMRELNSDYSELSKYKYDLDPEGRMRWYIRVEQHCVAHLKNQIEEVNDIETLERLGEKINLTKTCWFLT